MEKEEKTLETLLTTPVDRFAILMGKVSSTIIVAGVAAVTVLIGYNYMISSLSVGIAGVTSGSVDLVALGLVPSVGGYALLGISLFFTLLSALALAVVMSAFSENVRGAQALVGYIYPIDFPTCTGANIPRCEFTAACNKSSLLRHPLQPSDSCCKSSSDRRLWNSYLRDYLRCNLHHSHNVHCLATICNREDFNS